MHHEELCDLVRPVLEEEGFELVECSVSRTPRSQTFRVSIDRGDGVPVDACARISRRIAYVLDGNPMLRGTYLLEVSSPGMDRPIWSREHYRRFEGERVRLEMVDSDGARHALQGEIGPLEGDEVHLLLPGGENRTVSLGTIASARVRIDPWRRKSGGGGPRPGRGSASGRGQRRKER